MFSPLRGTRFHSRHHKNGDTQVKRPGRHKLQIERLEHRLLLANDPIVVDTAEDIIADDGVTSLREAIIEANARAGADVIQFAESLDGRRMLFSIAEVRIGTAATGDLDITDDLSIEGRGVENTIIDAGGIDRVFDLHGEIVVTISGTKIRGGQASDSGGGGGILNRDARLSLLQSEISGNSSDSSGGGILNEGTIKSIHQTTISRNKAVEAGGGIPNYGEIESISLSTLLGNQAGWGGAIYSRGAIESISQSTISGNMADNTGGAIRNSGWIGQISGSTISGNSADDSGAINNGGSIGSISQTTISGNTASNDAGAIENYGTIGSIRQTTITGNSGGDSGAIQNGGIIARMENTIIAGNGIHGSATPDLRGRMIRMANNNLIGSSQGHTISDGVDGNIIGVDPNLGPLADNGGPTLTHALLRGSPAIGAGSNPDNLEFDQRGEPYVRVFGNTPDIGAIEFQRSNSSIIVDTARDIIADDGLTSLREAIIEANARAGADVIQFSEFSRSIPIRFRIGGKGEDAAATGDLDITDDLTIEGRGAGKTIIDAGLIDRVFDLHGDITVAISGVTITGGRTSNDGGGGILVRNGRLSLRESTISGNRSNSSGGGIRNHGTIEYIRKTTISENEATLYGGGISNSGEIRSIELSTLSGNTADSAGAISNDVDALIEEISESTISENRAADEAGAINNHGIIENIVQTTFSKNAARSVGGIKNHGTINALSQTRFLDNSAARNGGAIENLGIIGRISHGTFSGNSGGTISNPGVISVITTSLFSNNSDGTIANIGTIERISESTFSGNAGGAIENEGTIETVTRSIFTDNGLVAGGAIRNTGLIENISQTTFSNNTSPRDFGGAIKNQGTIVSVTRSIFSGNTSGRSGGAISNDGVIENLSQSTFNDNVSEEDAGAIANRGEIRSIGESTFSGNSAWFGGAIMNYYDATIVSIYHSSILSNTAPGKGGGIYNVGTIVNITESTISGNAAGSAGAINNQGVIESLSQTTISKNTASDAGAIINRGTIISIAQTTISGNMASKRTGAIANRGRIGAIIQSTITENASYSGGGIRQYATGTIGRLENTIIAGNTASLRYNRPDLSDDGTITTAFNNLIGSSLGHTITDGASGNIVGVDPMLGPLADNGGFTMTHALMPGSPAIDASSHPSFFRFDQRGAPFRRSNGLGTDIGAFEYVTPIIVDTVRDVIADDGVTSLREAIIEANETTGADVIQFAGSSSLLPIILRIQGKGENAAATGDLDITDDLTIEGLGTGTTIIDADGLDRVLDLHGDIAVTLSGLTIRNGRVDDNGGGILNRGATLSLFEMAIIGNQSEAQGSAIFNSGTIEIISQSEISDNGSDDQHHTLYNDGTINHIDQSSFSNNVGRAIENLGSIGSISESVFSENTANSGGGIRNSGAISSISRTTFSNNSVSSQAGAISNEGTIDSIFQSTFSGNTSSNSTGAIRNEGTIGSINESWFTDNTAFNRAGAIGNSGTINSINETTFSGNVASGDKGGAIDNVDAIGNISRSTFVNNTAPFGGAISNNDTIGSISESVFSDNIAELGGAISNGGTIGDISESTLSGNTSDSRGGAITNSGVIASINRSSISDNTAWSGGAIYNRGWISSIDQTTISNNTARDGGAIYNRGWIDSISQSTISGNTASRSAGAIHNRGRIESISQSTITENSAYGSGGILLHSTGAIGTLESTIIAGNNTSLRFNRPDLSDHGTIVSANNNLIGSSFGHTISDGVDGNIVGVDPMLGPLADNGGPTMTHVLRPDSPAIGTGSNPLMLDIDQRGKPFKRVFGDAPDIGAVEMQPAQIVDFESVLHDAILSGVGDPVYQAELDFDGSGFIDIRDVQMLRRNRFNPKAVLATLSGELPGDDRIMPASDSHARRASRRTAHEQVFASLADGELTQLLPASWL